jgi:LysM repeat protein
MRLILTRLLPLCLIGGAIIGAASAILRPPSTAARPPAIPVAIDVDADSPALQRTPTAVVYVVQPGDTLAGIAARFGVPLSALARVNVLAEDAALGAGMMLLIPPPATPTLPPTATPIPSATPEILATNTSAPTPILATHTAAPSATLSLATNTSAPSATPYPIVTPHIVTPSPDPASTDMAATSDAGSAADSVSADRASSGGAPIILPNMDAPMPGPELINELPIVQIVPWNEATRSNVLAIFAHGQALGRNPRAFSKLGDSTIESPYFLDRFDAGQGDYNLGAFGYLQPLIDYFQGSFSRQGVAVIRGLHTWSVFDPMWANDYHCLPRETMLECEFRIHNPAYLFVRLGSNDVGAPTATERNLREVIEFSMANGVIPIMGTKADRHDGAFNTNNNIIRELADEYNVPLWDFDLIAGTLPGRGVGGDGVHLTTWYAHDYTDPEAFRRGYGVHNLTALIALYQTWLVVLTVPTDAAPAATIAAPTLDVTPLPTAFTIPVTPTSGA